MSYGIPHITSSSDSAEKQQQADREFSVRVAFDVTGLILSSLSRMSIQRFSMVDGPGLLPDHTSFAQVWHLSGRHPVPDPLSRQRLPIILVTLTLARA